MNKNQHIQTDAEKGLALLERMRANSRRYYATHRDTVLAKRKAKKDALYAEMMHAEGIEDPPPRRSRMKKNVCVTSECQPPHVSTNS